MTNENKIDLGSWNVPSDWSEISLLKFQEINKYYSNKDKKFDVRDVLEILCDKTMDEINQLPMEFLDIIMSKLSFLEEEPKVSEPSNKIEIDGETYIINVMEKLKTGEYISLEMARKDNPQNYAAFLGILCRKENEIFDAKFENEILPKRIEMFEKQPITKILPLVNFFLNCCILSVLPSQLSLQVKEGINQERQNTENLYKNGQISKRTMKSVMKTLKKFEKTINGI